MSNQEKQTLEQLSKIGEQANTNFKEQIEEDNHKDAYKVAKAFKKAMEHIVFFGTLALGLFFLGFLGLIGMLIFEHAMNLRADPEKTSVFISHTWSFVGGAIASVSLLSAFKIKLSK